MKTKNKKRNWSLLMKIIFTVPKVLSFKTTDLYTVYLFSQYADNINRKHHQLRIRSEILISLEIILNAFSVWQYHFQLKSLFCFFGYSTTFVSFSLHPLGICEAARWTHFTVTSRRRVAHFFLWEQMYTSRSTFIKKIKPFVCHYITMPQQYLKKRLHDKLLHHW